ncbi:hypothetical protein HJG60_011563 [Phyllostomus discolor]|uniref:Uncharacterized protein n=1 Tax=Phyllostomus discolor TaxID=89673 RepID=A0A834E391_9CHIR|nr:hypothetical protein HJG60_011563 [Phyllostomus discolor]
MLLSTFVYEVFFKILFIYRGEGREKEKKRNINVWLLLLCPLLGTWPATQACDQRPFGSQASAQSTEPHQPGLYMSFYVDIHLQLFRFVLFFEYIPKNGIAGPNSAFNWPDCFLKRLFRFTFPPTVL